MMGVWPILVAFDKQWSGQHRPTHSVTFNTLRLRQNGRRFADDTFKRIFLNENVKISIKISMKFVPRDPINNIPTLVQVMAWRRPGDKPLSEPMMVRLPTHICVTRPQWVNSGCTIYLNSLSPERCGNKFKSIILRLIIQNSSLGIRCEIVLGDWRRALLMISQHWFR